VITGGKVPGGTDPGGDQTVVVVVGGTVVDVVVVVEDVEVAGLDVATADESLELVCDDDPLPHAASTLRAAATSTL
jgi:hypothetical protein